MPISVTCACGKTFDVPDEFAGRKGKCQCGRLVEVPPPSLYQLAQEDSQTAIKRQGHVQGQRASASLKGGTAIPPVGKRVRVFCIVATFITSAFTLFLAVVNIAHGYPPGGVPSYYAAALAGVLLVGGGISAVAKRVYGAGAAYLAAVFLYAVATGILLNVEGVGGDNFFLFFVSLGAVALGLGFPFVRRLLALSGRPLPVWLCSTTMAMLPVLQMVGILVADREQDRAPDLRIFLGVLVAAVGLGVFSRNRYCLYAARALSVMGAVFVGFSLFASMTPNGGGPSLNHLIGIFLAAGWLSSWAPAANAFCSRRPYSQKKSRLTTRVSSQEAHDLQEERQP